MGISKIHVLYVGVFTQQGAMADDYVLLGKYLAERCFLYCLMGQSEKNYEIPGAEDVLKLTFNRYKKRTLFDIRNYINMLKYVQQNKIDIVYFKTPHPVNIFISIILRRYPQVLYCHDFKEHIGVSKLTVMRTEIEKKVQAYNAKTIFVASKSIKSRMVQDRSVWKEKKIKIIPLGVMENLVSETEVEIEDIDVLFFGRIEYYKGLDILSLAVKDEKWNVYVVGKGDLRNIYEGLELPPNVTFINRYVDDQILAGLIKRSKIVVLPYRDATGTQVIPTAMYCGKAVIATDVGSFGDYIRNGVDGIIIPPEDVCALNKAISNVLMNEKLRVKLCKNAVMRARNEFENSKISELYIREFEKIIAEHRSSEE